MQEQRLELEWDVLVEENLQNAPTRKEIYCIYKSAIKNNSIVGILQKVNNSETRTNINSNELLQSQLTGEQKKKMRLNKISDDVLWKEEIGKSGYTAYFVASCKKQGEQFYSRNDLLIFWHKTSVNVARRENRVILDILLQKYNVCGFIYAKRIHNKCYKNCLYLKKRAIKIGPPISGLLIITVF